MPISYADDLWRLNFHNHMVDEMERKTALIVSSACMNQCMIDVADIPEADVNSKVIVYGTEGVTQVYQIAEANGMKILR